MTTPTEIEARVDSLVTRLDRVESELAIRRLVARYAELVDKRDVDSLVKLYVDDVKVGRSSGRPALRRSLRRIMGPEAPFRATIHLVGGHVVAMNEADPDVATGIAYCRAEHEYGDLWVVATLQYWDQYQRRDGTWLFADRELKAFYAVDALERPNGPERVRYAFPAGLMASAELPEAAPEWASFWESFHRAARGTQPDMSTAFPTDP